MQGFRGNLQQRFINEDFKIFNISLMNWPIPLFVVGLSDHFRDAPTLLDDERVSRRC